MGVRAGAWGFVGNHVCPNGVTNGRYLKGAETVGM